MKWLGWSLILLSLEGCDDTPTRYVVEAYASAARAHENPKPTHPAADWEAATDAVAKSPALTIDNWNVATPSSHEDTACYWTTVQRDGTAVHVNFFLERHPQGTWEVSRVASARRCHCRRGFPCEMDP